MYYVPVILGSTRRGRQSPKVAHYMIEQLRLNAHFEPELLDLLETNFPIMEERLRMRDDAPPGVREFGDKLKRADAIVIVTPEYNNGYPGVLKNTLDYFLPEYKRKPVGVVTVSAGGFGGMYCLAQLRLVLISMGAIPLSATLPVSRVQDAFDEKNQPTDASFEKRAHAFIDELLWYTNAVKSQK